MNAKSYRIGCVSYLNAKPLIAGIEQFSPQVNVQYDVPSRLLSDLLQGQVDLALCPVIDYFQSTDPLQIVPVGCISSQRQTLTVRLFSQCPIDQITEVHADTDSRTSVMLLQIIMAAQYNCPIHIIPFCANPFQSPKPARKIPSEGPQSMLLIGDKVVTNSPKAITYPYQLDLGEAWANLTELPFVFAVWMTREGTDLGDLPQQLEQTRLANHQRIEALVEEFASVHDWPDDLAMRYFTKHLQYQLEQPERQAIERFGQMLVQQDLLEQTKPLIFYP